MGDWFPLQVDATSLHIINSGNTNESPGKEDKYVRVVVNEVSVQMLLVISFECLNLFRLQIVIR